MPRLPVRQGDVMFIPVDKIPSGGKKKEDATVAYGEVTGHSHRLAVEDLDTATVLECGDGLYVDVSERGMKLRGAETVNFVHEEHGPAALSKGAWRVRIQSEYSPEKISDVID